MIFNVSELEKINFNEVLETSINTVRKSIDLTKTFVKWDGSTPSSVLTLTTTEGPYNYDEMVALMSTPEWQSDDIIP
jgi:hypothetical protein